MARNPDGTPKSGYNVSGLFNNFNAGKLSATLNLNTEQGQQLAHRLIEKSDIFITNFRPDAIEKLNMRYDQLAAINPRLIAVYMPMQGLSGPHRDYPGVGATLASVAGLTGLSAFPHQVPGGIGNYPDYVVNPGHAVVAVMAALRLRKRTGRGQMIEVAQLESTVGVLGPALLDALVNGHNQERVGNRSAVASPHGAFRCADDPSSVGSADRWIVIACRDDQEWQALCTALGHPEVAVDPKFETLALRKANEDDLDTLISSWTAGRRAEELMELLQAHGIPAGVVQNAQDLLERDPHIAARGYYEYLDHPETGRSAYDGVPARLSRTPGHHARSAPLLGEHTFDVCKRILGLSDDEIADLVVDDVLS
jgi:benzylsuccinate CoA-transferase BbsF subunit